MKKIKVFTNNDLDGAGSLMLIKWAFADSCEIDHIISNVFSIKRDYDGFVNSNDYEDYSKVFILNIIPSFEVEDNVLVFSKGERLDLSHKGKVNISSSTTKLLREFFSKSLMNLSLAQNRLINTIDKFYIDGGNGKQHSMKLNAIFTYGRNKYSEFYTRFEHGLDNYSDEENTIISNYTANLAKTYKELDIFEHNTKKGVFIVLVSDMLYKHEMLDLLFKKHSPKMIFLVDLDSGFISVRKNDSLIYNMHNLCSTIIDGRALVNCAGGRYTEKFLDFSKSFM